MQNVSTLFQQKISDLSRYIPCRIEFDTTPTTVLDGSKFIMFDILEETQADSGSPLGSVSSNEMHIQIYTGVTDISFLVYNLKATVYASLEVSPDVFEDCLLGTYYVTDWFADAESSIADVTLNDTIFIQSALPVPVVPVVNQSSIQDMLARLFTALGLSTAEYTISAAINQALKYGWIDDKTLREVLQEYAVAGCLNIYNDRNSRYKVSSMTEVSPSVATLSDTDQILSGRFLPSSFKTYTGAVVKYNIPQLVETEIDSFSIPTVILQAGMNTLSDISFQNTPVVYLMSVVFGNSTNLKLHNVSYTSNRFTLVIENTSGASITTSINITGRYLKPVYGKITKEISSPSPKYITIESDFIQSADIASSYGDTINSFIHASEAYIELDVRGNPALELDDVITVNYLKLGLNNELVKITRCSFNYDGGLSGKIAGIRTKFL